MNLITAEKMLVLLEQSRPEHDGDEAFFTIERLLREEVKKGADRAERFNAQRAFDQATREESLLAELDKVKAIKMYRERTGHGLHFCKTAVEDGARRLNLEQSASEQRNLAPTHEEVSVWLKTSKVKAIKMYRERTGLGLYESNKNLIEAEKNIVSAMDDPSNVVFERVTSCS